MTFNILLVEDDENKRNQIGGFISEMYRPAVITYARSLQSGVKAVIGGGIDLIILDMTMPTFDISTEDEGGRPQIYAGRELLRQMDRRRMRTPVVVVTQFNKFGEGKESLDLGELDEQLRESHPHTYRGVVYYDAAVEGWKKSLEKLINSVCKREG
jgi:CheY-like chemotaxis protein